MQGTAGGLVGVALEDAFDTAGEGITSLAPFADEGLPIEVMAASVAPVTRPGRRSISRRSGSSHRAAGCPGTFNERS